MISKATWTRAFVSERLMAMAFNVAGKSNTTTFGSCLCSHRRAKIQRKDMFWTEPDSTVSQVPGDDHLFVLIDTKACNGVRAGQEDSEIIE